MITVRGTAVYDGDGMLFIPDSIVGSGAPSQVVIEDLATGERRA